ncbi:MAG: HEAT repeat domain-containing protein [Candidatus Zixiibacteriota bacterium]|nr:MAG: HEAT repeat domain-containing protein [candidate division Zixibacteria bacterium]
METVVKPDYGLALKLMHGAIRRLEMYPPGHPAAVQAIEKPFLALQEIFKDTDHLIISRVEDRIIVNGKNMEGEEILNRLLEEFDQENVSSLTFAKNLTKEELGSFLSFFVKPLGKKDRSISLPDFVKKNRLESIKVDKLRYELVDDDEVVVKSEVVEGADLKVQISSIMKENPDLLRDIFLSKTADVRESDQGEGSILAKREAEKQIESLSDEDLLELMAASLGEGLKKRQAQSAGPALNEVVDMVGRLLQNREKSKLLPRLKKMLSERGMVQEEHLDFLFEERWLQSQEVLDGLIKMLDKVGTEEVDFEKLMFLWNRVISSQETEIITYVMSKVLSKFQYKDRNTRDLVARFAERALGQFIKREMKLELSYVRDQLTGKITDPLLPVGVFQEYSRLLRITFSETIRRNDFDGARKILSKYHAHLSPEAKCSEETRQAAREFVREVTDESTLTVLMSQMKEGVAFQTVKLIEEVLESLERDKVAQKLLEIFTLDDRAARMSALRVLSRLGKDSISAFSSLLSDPGIFVRKERSPLLRDEQWYKVRNVIYALGNIRDREGIGILSRLRHDSDVRVRLEVTKALEKTGMPESVDVLVAMLKDTDDEVRRRVVSSLSALGDKSCLEPLMGHLLHNSRDTRITVAAIAKIRGAESTKFLLKLLRDEGIKHLPPRQKDEIKIAVFDMSREINSTDLADEIEKFVEQRGKGLKRLLVKTRVLESANRAVEAIRRKNHSHPVPSRHE